MLLNLSLTQLNSKHFSRSSKWSSTSWNPNRRTPYGIRLSILKPLFRLFYFINHAACTSGSASVLPVGQQAELTSPGYPYDVPEHLSCRWLLEAPEGQVTPTFNLFYMVCAYQKTNAMLSIVNYSHRIVYPPVPALILPALQDIFWRLKFFYLDPY